MARFDQIQDGDKERADSHPQGQTTNNHKDKDGIGTETCGNALCIRLTHGEMSEISCPAMSLRHVLAIGGSEGSMAAQFSAGSITCG